MKFRHTRGQTASGGDYRLKVCGIIDGDRVGSASVEVTSAESYGDDIKNLDEPKALVTSLMIREKYRKQGHMIEFIKEVGRWRDEHEPEAAVVSWVPSQHRAWYEENGCALTGDRQLIDVNWYFLVKLVGEI